MNTRIIGLVAICALATPCASASDASEAVVQQARQDCHAFENGALDVPEIAISLIDLTGDGRLDEIIDSSAFSCSSAASLFCGTGGCYITVIVDGAPTEFLAKGWRIVDWDGQSILLLAVHGSECGGTNVRRCYNAMVWSEGGFRGVDK